MPTILYINGWRFYFFANEGNEPAHIHAEKAEKNCKYWLHRKSETIEKVYSFKMNGRDIGEVEKIILQYFKHFMKEWERFQEKKI